MRYDFTGAFAPYICGLIAQKRAFGFDYLESERILYMFERFCQEQFPNETQITQQLVLKWAECRDCERNLFRLNRVSVIRELARYMNGKEELGLGYARIGFDDLTYTNVCGFLDWLTVSRGCSPQTVNLRLMAIRSFAKYSSIVDPAKIYFQVELANVPVKKAHGKVVEFMSLPALEALFLQPNTKKTTGFRDFCFMILMYDVAARCQELLDLRIGDLELQQNTPSVYLTGKGAKMRKLPISSKVAGHLKNYLNTAHPAISRKDEDFLFYTISHGHRNKMSSDAVSLFMRKYGETGKKLCSEFPDRVHPHQLRHSRAMHLYRGGMPLVLLSEFLGHADVNTTRIYAWADTEMKRQAIQKITDKCEANATIEPIWENDEQMIKRLYGLA